ncbi:WD40-repeat-containing domain protein [Pisolithus albus]|nr:WD40-repeat-containing domain protein [Pisolithus albus]
MLAIVTENGTGVVSPNILKRSGATIPISSSLRCTLSAWASDNSQLYLAVASHIKRYTVSEGLLEVIYSGPGTVTCLALADKGVKIFFAAGNEVHMLDCDRDVPLAFEASKLPISALALSNDSSLLASASGSTVLVHHLRLSLHTSLHGLPSGTVSCCIFHRHTSTKLLLGIERCVLLYDVTEPSRPSKTVKLRGSSGHVVAIGSSPFSRTLIAAAVSNGDVALIDLNKEHGILKVVNLRKVLTTLSFNADGGSLYLGTRDGMLLILDLRALEKEPKTIVVGDGKFPIRKIDVQTRSPDKHAPMRNSPHGSTTGPNVYTYISADRVAAHCFAASESPKSHSNHRTGNFKAKIKPQLGLTWSSMESQKSRNLGKGPPPPASTSPHLPSVSGHPKEETRISSSGRRLSSQATELTCGSRKTSLTCQIEPTELTTQGHPVHDVGYSGQETQPEFPFSVLQQPPVSHESLPKEENIVTTGADIAQGVFDLRSPKIDAWVKGTRKESDRRQDPLSHHEESERDGNSYAAPSTAHGSREWSNELALQVSPRGPTTARRWTSPPRTQAQPDANLSVNSSAQDFLRSIVRDVMYDFQRETKAEMMGIHLDLVRMGRGWRQELKEAIERWEGEAKQLREENKRLKEENERLAERTLRHSRYYQCTPLRLCNGNAVRHTCT